MLPSLLLLIAALAAPISPGAASHFFGIARAGADGPVLYREDHYRFGPPGRRQALVLYRCPDGKPFARKTTADVDALDPDFALLDRQNGYREGVRTVNGKREVYVHDVDAARTRSAPLPSTSTPVIDSGFTVFVHRHWGELMAGQRLKMHFLVPSRRKFLAFRVTRHRDKQAAAQGVVVLRLEIDHWFAFALPHIDVGYTEATRSLRWFRGLSNLRDAKGNNVRVVLTYPADQRDQTVTAAQIEAARKAPLTGRCSLD